MTTSTLDQKTNNSSFFPMLIIGGLFFIFGFITWLNGALIPFLKVACELSNFQAYLVTMSFYISYTLMALPMSYVLKKTGFKNGMAIGLAIMSIGAIIFIPAATLREFSIFLIGLFVLGTGLTILQTASNPYVVLIGSPDSAASRISIMGLLNKFAGFIAPILLSVFILGDMSSFEESKLAVLSEQDYLSTLDSLSEKLIEPYLFMAVALMILAIGMVFIKLPEISTNKQSSSSVKDSIYQFKHLNLGVLALFFYVGAEVIAGDSIGLLGQSLGVKQYTHLTSYTMAFMVLGYIFGILLIPKYLSQEKALQLSAILGIVISICILTIDTKSTLIASSFTFEAWGGIPDIVFLVAALGLSNALVWPAIWPLALKGLGEHTDKGSALLIMAISGGAILPLLYGYLVDITSAQEAYFILIPCYLVIFHYSWKGHKY